MVYKKNKKGGNMEKQGKEKALSGGKKVKPSKKPPAIPPTGNKKVDAINRKIAFLIQNNPQMIKWKKHKKRYEDLIKQHGESYCFNNAKTPEDKEFLKWFEPLKKVRLEIKLLKEKKEFDKNFIRPADSNLEVEKAHLPKIKTKPAEKKRQPSRDYSSGFFNQERQSGTWRKKR